MSFFVDEFSKQIWETKYKGTATSVNEYYLRLANLVALGNSRLKSAFYDLMISRKFSPGGRILAFAGRPTSKLSLMNCTTHAIEGDSLEDISKAAYTVMRASSRGQGIGINISALRPKDTPVDNAAKTSTGAISFMEMLNNVGGTIGQEGRRGALLFSIGVDHPDLYRPLDTSVVCSKCGGMGCGYCNNGFLPYDFLHVKKIPGKVENANISVMISDAFMQAVQDDGIWRLSFQGSSGNELFNAANPVSARDLFYALSKSAHASAEPGLLYWDTSKRLSNSDLFDDRWKIVGTNACSEEVLDQDGVCNLGSMNLAEYVVHPFTKDARFDFYNFNLDVMLAIEFLDNVVTLELQSGNYISKTQEQSLEYLRRLGLGVMGLADMLAMLNVQYGSKASIDITRQVFEAMRNAAYTATIILAKEKGPARVWRKSQEYHQSIIMGGFFQTLPGDLQAGILRYGTRNITVLSIAPTGSISNLLGVSSGIEPLFALNYTRRTRIHGYDEFIDYTHPGVAMSRKAGLPDSVWPTAYQVSPSDHLEIQAVVQEFVDASIAKTLNFPSSARIEDVSDAYMKGWQQGLKGMAVYVDGSRTEQVLYVKNTGEDEKCEVCGGSVVRKEGCTECPACGWSKCSL